MDSNARMESLLENIDEKKVSDLKLPSSPITHMFDQIDIKELVTK